MSLNAISPQTSQAALDWTIWLRSQRRRVVDFLLLIIVVLGAIGLTYLIGSRFLAGRMTIGRSNVYYLIAYGLILGTFFAKGLRAEWRAASLLVILYGFGVLSYWLGWLESGARVFMMALIVVGGVLVHPRAGMYLAALVVVTYAVIGGIYATGIWEASQGNVTNPRNIITEGMGLLINVGLVVASLWFMGQALLAATEANRQAQEARALAAQHAEELEVAIRDLKIAKEQAEAAQFEAEEARKRAELSDQVKSQFLASMSHELRTPLNAILNFSQVISMGIAGPVTDRQKEMLGEVVGSGKHLLALINDVLDMSKIQGDMLSLFAEENINLQEIIRSAAATTETLIKDKPIELVLDVSDTLPHILCDKRRVQQILLNLLTNATKFTEKGSITLRAQQEGKEIKFAVIDTGIGIAKEDLELIFQPFAQTEAGIKHMGGTGLGLPISKSLVEAHGGKLWVESMDGVGAAFYFTLLIDPPLLRKQIAASAKPEAASTDAAPKGS